VYFGFFAGLQLLNVASFSLALRRNDFVRCSVIRSSGYNFGGNVYGGGISIYMGGYSSSIKFNDVAVAAVGNTAVLDASVLVETVSFTSCRATTASGQGANSYGGSLSLYLGGYAWSRSITVTISRSSSSTSGSTTASGVSVSISNVNCSDCSATTTGSDGGLFGGNSYGGSISLYLGGYAWSYCFGISISSSSTSGLTTASGVSVSISNVNSSNCSAASYPVANNGASWGVNSYGGSMSVVYIGAYAWSNAGGAQDSSSSSSICGTTNVTSLVVSISSSKFADSSAGSRTFHSAPMFLFRCAYSRSSAEFGGGVEAYGSNVRAFAISAPSIILPIVHAVPSDARSLRRCTAAPPVS